MAKKSTATSSKGAAKQGGFGPLALLAAVKSPIKFLRRNGFVKGVLGGHNGWTAVAATLWVLRMTGKLFGKNEEILSTEKLTAGQFVRIESIKAPTRREIRRNDKALVAAAKRAKIDAKQAKADAKLARKLART